MGKVEFELRFGQLVYQTLCPARENDRVATILLLFRIVGYGFYIPQICVISVKHAYALVIHGTSLSSIVAMHLVCKR